MFNLDRFQNEPPIPDAELELAAKIGAITIELDDKQKNPSRAVEPRINALRRQRQDLETQLNDLRFKRENNQAA